MADIDAPTGSEPNPLTELSTIDPSPSFFLGLSMTSIYGFAESFVTPPLDLEINDEQSTELLASPLFPQEREASADRSQVYHSQRENLVSDSSRLQPRQGRPVAWRPSGSERNLRSILEEQRQQLLSEAHSEILNQECRAEKADAVIRELQRQIQSNRMEIGHTYEESRRERAQLYEELIVSTRKCSTRNSCSRSSRNGGIKKSVQVR